MNRILRRTFLLAASAGILTGAAKLIPLMRSVEIGRPAAPAVIPTAQFSALPDAPLPRQTESTPAPVQTAFTSPAVQKVPAIHWESDGSKAMHDSRSYQAAGSGDGGKILEKQYSNLGGAQFFGLAGGGQVRNCTSWDNADLLAESQLPPDLPLRADGTPVVLIYHTHTTESYVTEKTGSYDAGFSFRTTEPEKNMVAVGDAVCAELGAAGIGCIHAEEIHDFPVWSGSYANSAATVRAVLEKYPDICIALDIHRDAIAEGNTVYAPVFCYGGEKAAQIMIISGCDDGTMDMPDYRKNFHLASQLQQTAETMFPGFTRPILFDYRKYNQDLTAGSLLVEVGSQGNTLEEAVRAGSLLGKSLAAFILENCQVQNQGTP